MRLGTRGSALALTQARTVARLLGDDVEIVTVESSGSPADDKSRWTRSLDELLTLGEIDLALHCAKDVPVVRPQGIVTVAVPAREDPRDAICGAPSLQALPAGAKVGTSSPRREAQIRRLRDDLDVVELRGNIDTRLRKLEQGECDALILAMAGLRRLGIDEGATPLEPELFIPAAGQGTLLLEARSGDRAAHAAGEAITVPDAKLALEAERAAIGELDADCHTAVGVRATISADVIRVDAVALAADGSASLRAQTEGALKDAAQVGCSAARELLAEGAGELLASSRGEAS